MTDNTDIQFSKRFSRNVLTNVVYFIINTVIGLALVPFFIDTLGAAAYGLIPLATSLTSYITIFIESLNSSISRFLTISIQKNDDIVSNKTFNTALFGTLGIIGILLPVSGIVAWGTPYFFNIGNETVHDVFLLFFLIFLSILTKTWSSNFMVTLFAVNRLDLRNYVNILSTVSQCAIVILLFIFLGPSLVLVGLSYFISAVIQLLLAIYFSRRTCPQIKISYKLFSWTLLKEMGGMAFWILTDSIGVLLRYQIALILVNKLFGEIAGTEYSLAFTWFTLLVTLASLISSVFTPMIYSYYAKEDVENMMSFSLFSTKTIGVFIALPIALVCIFTPQLMTIWVGGDFAHLSLLVWIILVPCLFKVQAGCISPICNAFNKVRIPAFVNIGVGIITPCLALALSNLEGFGMNGIAIACSISILFIAVGMIPLYTAHILNKNYLLFYKSMSFGFVGLVFVFIIGMICSNILFKIMDEYVVVVLVCVILTSLYLLIVFGIVFNKKEKRMMRACLPK